MQNARMTFSRMRTIYITHTSQKQLKSKREIYKELDLDTE